MSVSKMQIFMDADAIFAGSASPSRYSASIVLLRLAELTLIEVFTSEQVIEEVTRNLSQKLPTALSLFKLLQARSLTIIPTPSSQQCLAYEGLADPKDLPILVAAIEAKIPFLATFNIRHFQPGHESIVVMKPGQLLTLIRHQLTLLS